MQMKSYCSVGGDTAHIRDLCTSILIRNDRRNTNEETFNTDFENQSILNKNSKFYHNMYRQSLI